MSSTPLFDAVARRSTRTPVPASTRASRSVPPATVASTVPAPTSPFSAPVSAEHSALVPTALVAAIDEIPARVGAASMSGRDARPAHPVGPDQLALVEAVVDAVTRAVVDAVVGELERITRDGVVRG